MQGFLNIDKPAGWTSRDVVNIVVKLCPRGAKVGHAGTLDPLATGVLVVAVGRATRLISYAQEGTKTYHGAFLLGRTSNTEDTEGQVEELASPPIPTAVELGAAAESFLGALLQRPPAFSAIQVDGQRSYDRARKGEQFELPSRPVRIDAIKVLAYEYPRFELEVVCGKGTYIRSLGRDIGLKLGSGAVMSALRRTRVGGFGIESAVTLETLRSEGVAPHLQPGLGAIPCSIPCVELDPASIKQLLMGQVTTIMNEADEIAITRGPQLVSLVKKILSNTYRASINLLTLDELT